MVTIGGADRVVTILNRWLTEAIGGGLRGLASNVHLRKVTVKLRLLHIWRTTENVCVFSDFQDYVYKCTDLGRGGPKF